MVKPTRTTTRKGDAPTEQSKLFKEKAREIGADRPSDDDRVMRGLAKQKRHEEAKKPAK